VRHDDNQENRMRTFILFVTCFLSASTTFASSSSPRAFINNEDSHPHEVLPGKSTVFYVDNSKTGGLVDVKCMLSGPVSSVTARANGFKLEKWKLPSKTFPITEPIEINIVGNVPPNSRNSTFEFLNGDVSRLLWHQCYNN
jgi:hypothetical protein